MQTMALRIQGVGKTFAFVLNQKALVQYKRAMESDLVHLPETLTRIIR